MSICDCARVVQLVTPVDLPGFFSQHVRLASQPVRVAEVSAESGRTESPLRTVRSTHGTFGGTTCMSVLGIRPCVPGPPLAKGLGSDYYSTARRLIRGPPRPGRSYSSTSLPRGGASTFRVKFPVRSSACWLAQCSRGFAAANTRAPRLLRIDATVGGVEHKAPAKVEPGTAAVGPLHFAPSCTSFGCKLALRRR